MRPAAGVVRLWGEDMRHLKPHTIARKIAVVDQSPLYTFPFTVEEIVLMGRYPHGTHGLFETDTDVAIVEEALAVTDTAKFRSRVVQSLSGGETADGWRSRAH